MSANFVHGKNVVFKVCTVDLSGEHTKVDFPRTADTNEVTTFGKSNKCYIAGLKGATLPFEGLFDTGTDATLAGFFGTVVTFAYYPAGTATGNVYYTGTGIMTAYNVNSVVNDAVKANGSIQCSDAISRVIVV